MSNFKYQNQELACDQIPLRELAEAFGTPTFVYSGAAIETAYQRLTTAFQGLNTLTCYAVKANANLSVLKRLHELGAGKVMKSDEMPGDGASSSFTGVGIIRVASGGMPNSFSKSSAPSMDMAVLLLLLLLLLLGQVGA